MSVADKVSMRDEALKLAELGLRVLPLQGKRPMYSLVEHAVKDATNDVLQVESWWEREPEANIGIAGGGGFLIIDVDNKPGRNGMRSGNESLKKLVQGKSFPKTVKVKSGGGGWHFYFALKRQWGPAPNLPDRLGPGLEVIGTGKYVVAPPSVHPDTGERYQWVRPPFGETWEYLPDWLWELCKERQNGHSTWDRNPTEIYEHEGRNIHMAAFAGSLRRSGATQGEIYDALTARNRRVCKPPLSDHVVRTVARSIARYKPGDPMVQATLDDAGNGERLAYHAKNRMIFVPNIGWHYWTGSRWKADKENLKIYARAEEVRIEIVYAADNIKDTSEGKLKPPPKKGAKTQPAPFHERLAAWGKSCGEAGRVRAMVRSAAGPLAVDQKLLDQDDLLLNLRNGVYNLETRQMEEHHPEGMFTRLANVSLDEEAECPQWLDFLEEILPDESVRSYIQRAVGYSLTGLTVEQCFFQLHGSGSNGKSTFMETLRGLWGNYAAKMASQTVMDRYKTAGGPTPEIVRLRGPRMVIAAESGESARLNEELIKELTGSDAVTARALFKDEIEFLPKFKLWMYSNYKPRIRGMDYGIWRRVRLIPFGVKIKKPNLNLTEELREERSGILNWALSGFFEWEKHGLWEPEVITEEVKEYQKDMDVVAAFLEERCKIGKDESEAAGDMWEAFSEWQRDGLSGGGKIGKIHFFERLQGLGYPRKRGTEAGRKASSHHFFGVALDMGKMRFELGSDGK